jgi:hypothetical protein
MGSFRQNEEGRKNRLIGGLGAFHVVIINLGWTVRHFLKDGPDQMR